MARVVALGLGFGVLAALLLGRVPAAPFGLHGPLSRGAAVKIATAARGPFTKGRVVAFSSLGGRTWRGQDQ